MDVARQVALNIIFFGIYVVIFVQTASGQYSVGTMVLLVQMVTMARMPVTSMSYLVQDRDPARGPRRRTPDELAVSSGIYSELLALQASASRADRRRLAAYDIAG